MELRVNNQYKETATGRVVDLLLITELPTGEHWVAFKKPETHQEFTVTSEQFKRDFEPVTG